MESGEGTEAIMAGGNAHYREWHEAFAEELPRLGDMLAERRSLFAALGDEGNQLIFIALLRHYGGMLADPCRPCGRPGLVRVDTRGGKPAAVANGLGRQCG